MITNNSELLKKCVYDTENISSLNDFWSSLLHETPLQMILESGNPQFLDILLHPKLTVKKDEEYETVRSNLYNGRVKNDMYLMTLIEQGRVSNMAYGAHVR